MYSDWIRKYSVFSPNTLQYGPEITPYLDTFHAVVKYCNLHHVSVYLLKVTWKWFQTSCIWSFREVVWNILFHNKNMLQITLMLMSLVIWQVLYSGLTSDRVFDAVLLNFIRNVLLLIISFNRISYKKDFKTNP